MGTIVCSL